MKKIIKAILVLALLLIMIPFTIIWFIFRIAAYLFCVLMIFLLDTGEGIRNFLTGNY